MKKRKKHNKKIIKDLYSWLHERGEIGNADLEDKPKIDNSCEIPVHNFRPELFAPGNVKDHFEY